jgi:uncharacterized protein
MITRLTSLSKNMVQFCRFLRQKGFTVTVEEEVTALKALQYIDYSNNHIFFLALQASFCRSKLQLDEFEKLFREYWKEIDKAVDAKLKKETTKKPQQISQPQIKSLKAWLHGNKNNETEEAASYSVHENLLQKDFSAVPEEDVEELMQCIKALSKRLAAKANRRYEPSHKINLPDLRLTLRKNLRSGGELIDIIHRRPKRNRVKLLVLCDVSKSMELYSAFLIQFMYAFHQVYSRMETFVFSTALQRITTVLKQQNFREAMQLLSAESIGWSGGTKIGESLDAFIKEYGHPFIDSKTIVIILSDGWDTGNTELIEKNLAIMHAKAKKIIWLNPLAGYTAYRPDAAGMKAAMPFIDVFGPVHNAESLRKLAGWI